MNLRRLFLLAVVFSGVVCGQAPSINGCPSFPANNIWNAPVDTLPVAAHSADYIGSISATGGLRYDITIPVNIVPGTQPKVPLNITYPDESDPGPYPIPLTAQVEASSDRHVLVVDKDNCILYETFNSFLQPDGSWNVDSSAKWSLLSNALRPADWTSADAAGLPIMPGLVRYDEILAGQIDHALRFTAPSTQRLYVWPGRHYASSSSSPLLPPMGQRFRLKASVDISGYSANMQIILRAIKKYGLMLADNGLPWEMQIAVDPRWNTNELDTLGSIIGSNIEAVDVSSLMIDPNSGQAVSSNPPAVVVTPASPTMGLFQTQQFTATVTGSSLGVTWSMSPTLGTLSATGFYTAPSSLTGSSSVTVTATLADGSASGKTLVTLVPATAALASVSVSPGAVVGGSNVNVTVTLTLPALGAGLPVTLTGSNSAFPTANVTVSAGLLSQTFNLPTSVVAALASVTITASYNGNSVTSSAISVLAPPSPGKASYVRTDTTTSGSWKGAYGADGYNVIGDSASYPSYVVVTPYGQSPYTWVSSTFDARGLQIPSSATDRIAACWFAVNSFTVDLSFGDANTHQLSLYLLDWEGGRSEHVDILDAANNVLDTRSAGNFANGEYLVWNVSGHVVVRITSDSSRTAVLSGIFFGGGTPPPPPTGGTVSYVKTDTTAAGTWKGVYGADGYNVINDTLNYPSYVAVTPSGNSPYTWVPSTSDARALQKASSTTDRIAACWYTSSLITIDLKFNDSNTHQLALYFLDWDGNRSERVDILDANNSLFDTRTVSAFTAGEYLVWNVSGHVVVRITNTGSNAVLSGIFFGTGTAVAPPPPPPPSSSGAATYVKTDTTTAGTWKGVYGADGANVINDTASYPSYVTVTPSGNASYSWVSSTSDTRALQKASSTTDRIAACWYTGGFFTVDLNFNDTNTHALALYLLDWDGGRSERVDILDTSNNVLDTRTVTAFTAGEYLVWNVSGHVVVRITNTGSNAVVSGIFFGGGTTVTPPPPPPPPPSSGGAASYVKTDTTTAGTWKSVYGADGYNVINDTVNYPSYVTVTPSGNASYTWISPTSDTRALQQASSTTNRIAACWYTGGFFTIDLSFNDTNTHALALYLLDWDGGRSERVDILDTNNNVLDTRAVTAFTAGRYLVWNVSGHVVVRISNTASNAVVSGIFFGSGTVAPPPSSGGAASYVKTDTATAGTWKSVYGADGYNVINDTANYPSYVTVTPSGNASYTWISPTSDTRALQKASSTTDRIAACWYTGGYFTIDLSFNDANTHALALYLLDWDGGRSERVDILDTNNNVLDTRTVTAFTAGQYLVWNVSGHVVVRITNTASNAVVSGIFFGSGTVAPPPSSGTAATYVKTDATTAGAWKGVYGADGSNVINDTVNYPSYVTVTPAGNTAYTWISPTSDVRALQKASSTTGRIAACWYTGGFFTVDLNFNDTNTHQVALYLLDWDGGRSERVDILDAGNHVLDTRTVTAFTAGEYLVWNVSGHVVARITNTASNAVLSGIFFR
ncbi:MAG TPA: hypothetical protein VE959_00820 [Bryobacteraceae bacterium]|nr:hypothetical protein [Bryobacteraceae bacterium]